jgi:hypothetical protein
LKPVQAAASFFVTLTVDGQNRDLVNIWRGVDVEGGDGADDGVAGAARCAWTGDRSGGVSHRASAWWAAVMRPVPSPLRTTTVLWGGEGGPGAVALQAAPVL